MQKLKKRLREAEEATLRVQRQNQLQFKRREMLSFAEIEQNYERVEQLNNANFTSKAMIRHAIEPNDITFKIAAYAKGRKIWKPTKVKFGCAVSHALEERGEKT